MHTESILSPVVCFVRPIFTKRIQDSMDFSHLDFAVALQAWWSQRGIGGALNSREILISSNETLNFFQFLLLSAVYRVTFASTRTRSPRPMRVGRSMVMSCFERNRSVASYTRSKGSAWKQVSHSRTRSSTMYTYD